MNQLIGYLSEGEQLKGSLTIPQKIGGGGGGNLQDKTVNITPTESAQSQTMTADPGYDGLGEVGVNVGAISGSYVGSQVPRKSSSDLTASGATVTAPAGYYESAASKAIPTAGCNVGASVQKNTQTHVATISPYAEVDPAGYIEADIYDGDAVTVSASELVSGTKSITANGQGIDVTDYEDVDVNVPNSYSASDEGKVVSNGALVAQTAHADVTPTTSDQTIDTMLNNSLKVKGDADLVAGNIKKDVEIFGVTGSYEGGGGSSVATGTFTPASLTGSVTINTGLTTVHGLLIIPAESLDLSSSTYKVYTVWLEDPATYIKMFCARRNSSSRSFEVWVSGTPPYSISGGTIDIAFGYPSNTGFFDTKEYKWYAW